MDTRDRLGNERCDGQIRSSRDGPHDLRDRRGRGEDVGGWFTFLCGAAGKQQRQRQKDGKKTLFHCKNSFGKLVFSSDSIIQRLSSGHTFSGFADTTGERMDDTMEFMDTKTCQNLADRSPGNHRRARATPFTPRRRGRRDGSIWRASLSRRQPMSWPMRSSFWRSFSSTGSSRLRISTLRRAIRLRTA